MVVKPTALKLLYLQILKIFTLQHKAWAVTYTDSYETVNTLTASSECGPGRWLRGKGCMSLVLTFLKRKPDVGADVHNPSTPIMRRETDVSARGSRGEQHWLGDPTHTAALSPTPTQD